MRGFWKAADICFPFGCCACASGSREDAMLAAASRWGWICCDVFLPPPFSEGRRTFCILNAFKSHRARGKNNYWVCRAARWCLWHCKTGKCLCISGLLLWCPKSWDRTVWMFRAPYTTFCFCFDPQTARMAAQSSLWIPHPGGTLLSFPSWCQCFLHLSLFLASNIGSGMCVSVGVSFPERLLDLLMLLRT